MPITLNREREETRQALAEELWRVPYSKLLRYGISSYREITHLDRIGVPVWTAIRPLAKTISVSGGKSLDWLQAFAGSIIEAMEFWAVENPWGQSLVSSHTDLKEHKGPLALPFGQYALARESLCNEAMAVSWETMDMLTSDGQLVGRQAWVPSDLVWMTKRVPTQFQHFQVSSNGVASGSTTEDAVLSGLYELIERDAWTLSSCLFHATGGWPTKVPLGALPEELAQIVVSIRTAGLFPFLFDITTEFGVPTFGCAIFDVSGEGMGTFGGYGAHLHPVAAAKRALLEACQSRATYISGARDDLYRREFMLLKKSQQQTAIDTVQSLPTMEWDWTGLSFDTVKDELVCVLERLFGKGINKVFVRILAEEKFGRSKVIIVRVVTPQLEGIKFDSWRSNGRAIEYVRRSSQQVA